MSAPAYFVRAMVSSVVDGRAPSSVVNKALRDDGAAAVEYVTEPGDTGARLQGQLGEARQLDGIGRDPGALGFRLGGH